MNTKFSLQKTPPKNQNTYGGIIERRLTEEFQDSFIAKVYCPCGMTNT